MQKEIDPNYCVDWYRTPLPKEVLEGLNERSDARGWFQSLFSLGSIISSACYNLGKLHEAIKHDLPRTYNGVFEMWWHIIAILWRQKHEPGYTFIPTLPGEEKEVESTEEPVPVSVPKSRSASPSTEPLPEEDPSRPFRIWECSVCGFIYDERKGLLEEGFAPGTRWEDIPDDWRCPDCGVAKADFDMVEKTGPVTDTPDTMDVALDNDPIVIIGSGLGGWDVARE